LLTPGCVFLFGFDSFLFMRTNREVAGNIFNPPTKGCLGLIGNEQELV